MDHIKEIEHDELYLLCKHEQIIQFKSTSNCKICGAFIPKDANVQVMKQMKVNYGTTVSPNPIYKHLIKSNQFYSAIKHAQYLQERKMYINWIFDTCEKLKLSQKTTHLAVAFIDICINRDQTIYKHIYLYLGTCILLAAKSIEIDDKIPMISTLKQIVFPTYSIDEFRQAERLVIEILQFNLVIPTVIEVLEYYISQGILFSDDTINTKIINIKNQREEQNNANEIDQKSLYKLLMNIEKELLRLANAIIRDDQFLIYDRKVLAGSAIAFMRQTFNIQPVWNVQLQQYYDLTYDDMQECLSHFFQQFQQDFRQYTQCQKTVALQIKQLNKIVQKENQSFKPKHKHSYSQISQPFKAFNQTYIYNIPATNLIKPRQQQQQSLSTIQQLKVVVKPQKTLTDLNKELDDLLKSRKNQQPPQSRILSRQNSIIFTNQNFALNQLTKKSGIMIRQIKY